jgi:hypothetical protein
MALSLNSVFEVRGASGNDTNGGGFVTGAAGTDYSQQGAKNSGANDKSVADGVTAGTTTVTSATANFGTTIVGNIIYIAGGTGSITGAWYQVTARASATSITVDRATGLTAGTGVTINIGGALATIQAALALMTVTGQTTYVKADGTYSISTGLTVGAAGSITARTRVSGYTTTRGDGGVVTIQATAAITMLTQASAYWTWENVVFDGNAATATNGINASMTGGTLNLYNVTLKNFSGYGLNATANSALLRIAMDYCEVTGCGATAGVNVNTCSLFLSRCFIHDNTTGGVAVGGTLTTACCSMLHCIFANNSGATSDGLWINCSVGVVFGNVFYNNGRDGLQIANITTAVCIGLIANNILSSNGHYGLNLNAGGSATTILSSVANNAYYNNGTAARNGFAAELGAVTLTADPFNAVGSNNFTLNANAGGGVLCRAAGTVGAIPSATGIGYEDIGVYQHNDPPVVVGRRGGLSLAGR